MKSLAMQIKERYDHAHEAGRLAKSGAMPLTRSCDLVVVPKSALKKLEARIAQLEREVDDWKTEASFAQIRADRLADARLLFPSMIHNQTAVSANVQNEYDLTQRESDAEGLREPYAEISIKAPRLALVEIFGSYFATQSKQV